MKTVISVRHGRYVGDSLTADGISDVESLTKKIQRAINGKSLMVVHSNLPRARETAKIISDRTGADSLICERMELDDYYDAPAMIEEFEFWVDIDAYDVLLTVGHFEAPSGIISHYREANGGEMFPCREIGKGHALMLDLESGEVQALKP